MVAAAVILLCALALYWLSQGAPYVPTSQKDARTALQLMDLKKDDLVVDMGAGDGAVLVAAAKQGYRAVGIELNFLLWCVARVRTRKFGSRVHVVHANIWRWQLPDDTRGVFLFTAGPFTARMQAWIRGQQQRLGRPLTVVSLGFALPGETPEASKGPCILYRLR